VFSDWFGNTMPEVDQSLFTGDSDSPYVISKFEVTNLGARVNGILKKTGWNGAAQAASACTCRRTT
jgi:hypothetical protein